jgi:hypothetical protein
MFGLIWKFLFRKKIQREVHKTQDPKIEIWLTPTADPYNKSPYLYRVYSQNVVKEVDRCGNVANYGFQSPGTYGWAKSPEEALQKALKLYGKKNGRE